MAILSGDIKLVASQVMDDIDEGGGAPTPTIIQDGTSNSIFNDISELDRAGGRVNLRKVFASIQTGDTDTYLGSNVIVADPPDDPLVSVTLFSTGEVFDRRDDARDRIEAYLNKGSLWNGYLLENHIAGQRAIQLFQRPGTEPPTIGRTLCLIANEGLSNEYFQYVRITKATAVTRTFTIEQQGLVDYEALVVTCDLSDALRHDFPGSAPSRYYIQENGKAKVRDTVVANAALYYGAAKTTAAVDLGDISAEVEEVFTRLVPSAQTETPLLNMTAGGTAEALINSAQSGAPGTVTITTSTVFNASTVLFVGNSIQPTTFSILVGALSLVDDGGELLDGSTVVGTLDYARGEVRFATGAPSYSGSKTIMFRPGAAPIRIADTAGIQVDIESRAYNYLLTIVPPPAPGTLLVSYRAQGNWYDLRDNGAGVLRGSSPSYGVGTVSYSTGATAVTLGALPDVGSEILYAWGGQPNYINRSASSIAAPSVTFQLAHAGVTPGSVEITWNDGTPRTAIDDGKGLMTGHATGSVNYQTGLIKMTPSQLPASSQEYQVEYGYGPPVEESFPEPARNQDGTVTLEMLANDLVPGSIEVEWNLLIEDYEYLDELPAEMQYAPTRYYMSLGSYV